MSDWTMTIKLKAREFPTLQRLAKNVFEQILKAKSYREIQTAGASTGGVSYSVECQSPVELQIVELRRRAHELEASLGQATK